MTQGGKPGIGELLVQEGFITKEQLEKALVVQKNQTAYKPLGEVLVDLNLITRVDLNRILSKHNKRIQVGQLLINLGLLNDEQLRRALERQKEQGGTIGKVLVQMGYISENTLINALSIQMGVPKIAPDYQLIDKSLLNSVKKDYLLKNNILPAFKEEGVLTVIMANPKDNRLIADLSHIYQCTVEPAIASPTDIRNTLRQHFEKGKPDEKNQEFTDATRKTLVIGDTSYSLGSGDNIVGILNYLLTNAIREGASDIHIQPEEKRLRIRYRIDGILRHITDLPLSLAPALTSRIKVLCGLDIAEKRRHQDGRISAQVMEREVDFRVSTYASAFGESVVFRVLHRQTHLIDVDALGFSPINRKKFQTILDQPSGIILVTGPTGSGKTTTLYAALNYLNNGERSIITVEDPIEYAIGGIIQGQLETKIGQTYVDFLKAMMRQDPDVIMVGEIRDHSAAEAVIQAALTGHKVLSTFHTDDTTGALLRLMDMGIDTFLISSTVVSVIAQRLVRVLCRSCRKPQVPDKDLLNAYNVRNFHEDRFTFYQPVGCPQCSATGFKGRTAIHELLVLNDSIRDGILARKTSTQIRLIGRRQAELIGMREDGFYKAALGMTSLEEVLRVVFYNESDELAPRDFDELIALCEGRSPPGHDERPPEPALEGTSPAPPKEVPAQETPAAALTTDSQPPVMDGEVYRVRFETATIKGDTDQIADFFRAIQKIMAQMGKGLHSDVMGDFIDYIVTTVKRLEISMKAEFVEFCLRVKEGRVKIFLETLIPQRQTLPTAHRKRETDLRLINFLMPPSGLEKVFDSDPKRLEKPMRKPSLVGFLRQREPEPLKASLPQEEEKGYALLEKNPSLYKRHTEELNLSGYLED